MKTLKLSVLFSSLFFVWVQALFATEQGHYHVSSKEKKEILKRYDREIVGKMSSKRWGRGETSVKVELERLVNDLAGPGVLSPTEKNLFFNYPGKQEQRIENEKSRVTDCRWCAEQERTRDHFNVNSHSRCKNLEERNNCQFRLTEIKEGFLTDQVFNQVVPKVRRSNAKRDYLNYLKSKLSGMIKTAPDGENKGLCGTRKCGLGLSCAMSPSQPERKKCRNHSDCESRVCESMGDGEDKYCAPVRRCYKPVAKGKSCDEVPVCKGGLSCQSDNETGADPLSSSSSSKKCMRCSILGEEASNDRPCCPGLVANREEGKRICVQPIPENLKYKQKVGKKTHVIDDEFEPHNLETCESDWYQAYLEKLKRNYANFEREMALLSFEYVAGGDDNIEDYWGVNKRLNKMARKRRFVRHQLFEVLKAENEDHEEVLKEVRNAFSNTDLLSEDKGTNLYSQLRELTREKETFKRVCEEINDTDVLAEEVKDEGIKADSVRATKLARNAAKMEQRLMQFYYNNSLSLTFQELETIKSEMRSVNWKDAEYKVYRKKWKESKNWFEVVADFAVGGWEHFYWTAVGEFSADELFDKSEWEDFFGDMVDGPATGFGDQLGGGVFAALWGDTKPEVKVKELKCSVKVRGIVCKYRITIKWPYTEKCGETEVNVLATSGACLKRYAFTGFQGKPDLLVDPFVPVGFKQEDFFKRKGEMQPNFVSAANRAADKSIRYLKRREKPGLNRKAIRKANPAQKGNYGISRDMRKTIKNKALDHLNDEYEGIKVSQEFLDKWKDYTLEYHYLFPKLSLTREDVGYPQRGLLPYLSGLSEILNRSLDDSNDNIDSFGEYADANQRLLNKMGRVYEEGIDTGNDTRTEADSEGLESPDVEGFENTGTAGAGEAQIGTLGGDNLSGESLEGSGDSSIAQAFAKNRKKNERIIEDIKKRRKKMRDQLNSQGGDPESLDRKYAGLYSSLSSPSKGASQFGQGFDGDVSPPKLSEEKDESSESKSQFDNKENTPQASYSSSYQTPSSYGGQQGGSSESSESRDMIADSAERVNKNKEKFNPKDKDSLFDIVTKAYFRSYDKVLKKK